MSTVTCPLHGAFRTSLNPAFAHCPRCRNQAELRAIETLEQIYEDARRALALTTEEAADDVLLGDGDE